MSLSQTDLPRHARVFYAGLRRSSGSAVVPADQDNLGFCLCNAGCDSSDACFRNEFYADAGVFIGVFQIENKLGQVLDRINIMMRRRRDQADTGRRIPGFCDPWIDLVSRKLSALARLSSLGDLYLKLLGVDQVMTRYAESPGCNLFYFADLVVAICQLFITLGILAALACIAPAADTIHGYRKRFVGLGADRAIGHRTRFESFDDLLHRFHLFDRE